MEKSRVSPRLRRDEYDAFLSLIKDNRSFPQTYDDWLEHITKHDAHYASQGWVINENIIHPQEFADWCGRSGVDPSLQTLHAFCAATVRRNS